MDLIAEQTRFESYVRAWRSVHRRERRERLRSRWRRARWLMAPSALVGAVLALVEVWQPGPIPGLVVAGAVPVVVWLALLVDPY